jgi:hypothetical protein
MRSWASWGADMFNRFKPKTKTPDELIKEAWDKEALLISRSKTGITESEYEQSYREVRGLYEDINKKFDYPLALNKLAMLIADYARFRTLFIPTAKPTDKDKITKEAKDLFNEATDSFNRAIRKMEEAPDKDNEVKKLNYYKTKNNKALHIYKGLIITEPKKILVPPDVDGSIQILEELCKSEYAMGCYYLGGILYECSKDLQIGNVEKRQMLRNAIERLHKSNSISDSNNKVNPNNREETNSIIRLCEDELSKLDNSKTEQRFQGSGGTSQLKRTSRTTKSRKHRKRVKRLHKKSRRSRSRK